MSKKTEAQQRREAAEKELHLALNKAREKRTASLKLVGRLRREPRLAADVKQQMIEDLRRVFETKHSVLGNTAGRDRYRQIGHFSEVLVRLLFGTHANFKVEAELADTPTMRKGALRSARLAQAQKVAEYAERCIHPYTEGRFEFRSGKKTGTVSAVISSDHHSSKLDPFARRVLMDVLAWTKPDYNIWNGDVVDFSSFSTHRHLPGHFDLNAKQECEYVVDELFAPAREASPGSRNIMLLGNHEWRLVNYMADRASALACLDQINFVELFKLDDLDIDLVCRSNFLAPTAKMRKRDVNENWLVLEDCFVATHGLFTGPNSCAQHVKRFQMTGINGHEHGPHYQGFNSIATGPIGWYVSPMMAGHAVGRDYVSLPSQWQMGFCFVEIDVATKHVQVTQILVGDSAYFAGRKWEITAAEKRARAQAWLV